MNCDEQRARNTIAHLPSSPVHALDKIYGPHVATIDQFARRLINNTLEPSTLEELFKQSAGRINIAQTVLDSANSAGLQLDKIDPANFSYLIPSSPPSQLSEPGHEFSVVYMLKILSWLPTVHQPMIALAHNATKILTRESTPISSTGDELVADLVIAGLLSAGTDRPGIFRIPDLVRTFTRRINNSTDIAEEGAPKQALVLALEKTGQSFEAGAIVSLDQILTLSCDLQAWGQLEAIWARHGMNIFFMHLTTATTCYVSIPDDVIASRPVLAEARNAARQVSSTSRCLNTTEPTQVLVNISFDMSDVPRLEQIAQRLDAGAFTSNEVVVMTLATARAYRFDGDFENALKMILLGWKHLRARIASSGEPSRYYGAELHREHAITLACVGDYRSSVHMMRRAMLIAERAMPGSPYPLLAIYSSRAQIQMLVGRGSKADLSLRKFEHLRASLEFSPVLEQYLAATARLFRSLDQLDLTAAKDALDQAKSECDNFDNDDVLRLGEGLYQTYIGRPSFYTKTLDEETWTSPSKINRPLESMRVNVLSFVYLAAGEIRPIQRILSAPHRTSPGYALAEARLSYVLGQIDEMDALIPPALASQAGPRLKGSAHALRAAGLYHRGRSRESLVEFEAALDYCVITSTLLPVAQLPRAVRSALITQTGKSNKWKQLANSFGIDSVSADALQQRLLELPDAIDVTVERSHVLSRDEVSLLFKIETTKSISTIAGELGCVDGTVKNRLSAMYKKMGVRNRKGAVEFGYRNGYFTDS